MLLIFSFFVYMYRLNVSLEYNMKRYYIFKGLLKKIEENFSKNLYSIRRHWHHHERSILVSPKSLYKKNDRMELRNIQVLCWFLPCPAGVGELLLAQVNCFSGYPHHVLDLFVHILTFLSPTGHWELSPMLHCGSLPLFPPVAG